MEFIDKFHPVFQYIRDLLMKVAEFVAKYIPLASDKINVIVMILLSLWIARTILMFFYVTLEGRIKHLVVLSAVIYFILNYI